MMNDCSRTSCSERYCRNNCDECRFTIAEILRNIVRSGCDIPVRVWLNTPGSLSVTNTVSSVNLAVGSNASVTGSTESKSISITGTGTIPAGTLNVATTGTVDIPGLAINPASARTVDGVTAPVSIQSTGTSAIDLTRGSASGTVQPLAVRGSTQGQTINVPIEAEGEVSFVVETHDNVDIPALNICCNQCPNGLSTDTQICRCMKFTTEPQRVPTEGTTNFIETPVTVETTTSAYVPSTGVSGSTASTPITLGLVGQGVANVSVSSVAGSNVPIPRLGVSGVTEGASGVATSGTGTNTSSIPVSGTVSGTISPLSLSGTAATNGLPVTGDVEISSKVCETPISFIGMVVCSGDNYLILRELGTNREIVLSLCDILKISFPHFPGIECMSRIFEMNCLDKCSCAYGIQKNLHLAKCKPGTIDLYGSGTNNPVATGINTSNIKVVNGGVIWIIESKGCMQPMNTVYSICNIAGYAFTPLYCK